MTEHEINELKFIWAHMIMEGAPTDGNFSYYGGGFTTGFSDWREIPKHREKIIKLVREHDVAWEATGLPEYRVYSQFAGTDCESESIETLCGMLILRDGSKFKLGAMDVPAEVLNAVQHFSQQYVRPNYVKDVFG